MISELQKLKAQQQATQNPQFTNQQIQQSNMYTDYRAIMDSCNQIMEQKIMSDPRWQSVYGRCEQLIKQVLYMQVIPYILETPQGKSEFTDLLLTTKSIINEIQQTEAREFEELKKLKQALGDKQIADILNQAVTKNKES